MFFHPPLRLLQKKNSYLAAERSTQETYKITISTRSLVKCSCKGFRYSNICSHSIAVLEKEGVLNSHIAKFKNFRSPAWITYPIKPGGEGRKKGQKCRQRLYEEKKCCSQENLQLFTEVWHNNESLILKQVKDVLIGKNFCAYCQNEFSRVQLAIFLFECQRKMAVLEPKSQCRFTTSSGKKLTNMYYCIRQKCIYNRFPYLTAQLLKVKDGTILRGSHKKIIKEQRDVSI